MSIWDCPERAYGPDWRKPMIEPGDWDYQKYAELDFANSATRTFSFLIELGFSAEALDVARVLFEQDAVHILVYITRIEDFVDFAIWRGDCSDGAYSYSPFMHWSKAEWPGKVRDAVDLSRALQTLAKGLQSFPEDLLRGDSTSWELLHDVFKRANAEYTEQYLSPRAPS